MGTDVLAPAVAPLPEIQLPSRLRPAGQRESMCADGTWETMGFMQGMKIISVLISVFKTVKF